MKVNEGRVGGSVQIFLGPLKLKFWPWLSTQHPPDVSLSKGCGKLVKTNCDVESGDYTYVHTCRYRKKGTSLHIIAFLVKKQCWENRSQAKSWKDHQQAEHLHFHKLGVGAKEGVWMRHTYWNVVYTAYGQGVIFHFFVRLSHCGFYMSANYMQHA